MLIGGEGSSVSSSAIEGRAGVSEANGTGIIGDKWRVEGQNRPHGRDCRLHDSKLLIPIDDFEGPAAVA